MGLLLSMLCDSLWLARSILMAGDWIPFLKNLPRKPEVLRLVRLTGLTREQVVLALLEFWAWVDDETTDGHLPSMTPEDLEQACHGFVTVQRDKCHAFVLSMSEVGWLQIDDSGITVPNFGRWMDRPAKERLLASRRKRNSRAQSTKKKGDVTVQRDKCHAPAGQERDKSVTTIQDNTVQSKSPPNPPSGGEKSLDSSAPNQGPEASAERRRVVMPCDRPDLQKTAERVRNHYHQVVNPEYVTNGRPEILTLLDRGLAEADLIRAADGYAAHCRSQEVERRSRQGAAKFYSDSGLHADFLDYAPKPYTPPKRLNLPDVRPGPEVVAEMKAATHQRIPPENAPSVAQDARGGTRATQTPSRHSEAS